MDVLIPPDIVPTEESIELVDEGTAVFAPTYGVALTQRNQFFEPYVQVTQVWRSLRGEDRARMIAAVDRLGGRLNTLRAVVGYSSRGSFPDDEVLTNNTFANGTTGWSASSSFSLSVSDRRLRMTVNDGSYSEVAALYPSSGVTLTPFAPYIERVMQEAGLGPLTVALQAGTTSTGSQYSTASASAAGLQSLTFTPYQAASYINLDPTPSIGAQAGDYIDVSWISLSRCALVDNSPNLLLYSDQFDNAAWTKTRCSVSANATTAPDGTSTADSIIEDSTASNTHGISQAATVSASTSLDCCATFIVKAGARTWARVTLNESTGPTEVFVYINLSTGATGTTGTGANWSDFRYFVTSLGNGWWRIHVVARKTSATTTITAILRLATGDGGQTYSGDGVSNIYAWRGGIAAPSPVPFLPSQTTSAASSGTSQTGSNLYVKGLPASTDGLLLPGDPFVINGELKRATAALNSDAAGLGYLQFAPALFQTPDDNATVIVNKPMSKFMLTANPKWTNKYGVYADLELSFRCIYEP